LERVGELLAKRKALFDGWLPRVRARGFVFKPPRGLRLEGDYAEQLRGVLPAGEIDKLTSVDHELGDAVLGAATDRMRELLVASIRRHEVQHRIDFARPSPLPMPAVLETHVGPVESDGKERRHAVVARDELSAYLAELSRDEVAAGVD